MRLKPSKRTGNSQRQRKINKTDEARSIKHFLRVKAKIKRINKKA
jgi:hypothetical protein